MPPFLGLLCNMNLDLDLDLDLLLWLSCAYVCVCPLITTASHIGITQQGYQRVHYGVPFVSKLKMMLVFTIHAGIYTSCWYRKYQHEV